jgi:hypothetical protein
MENEIHLKTLDNLAALLEDNFLWSKSILDDIQKEELHTSLQFFMINYIERIIYSLDTVRHLIPVYKKSPHYETSIGLILRTSLLDFLTITYLTTVEFNGNRNLQDELNGLIGDQVSKTIHFLKTVRQTKCITEEEFSVATRGLFDTYSFLFSEYDLENFNKKMTCTSVSPAKMFKDICDNENTRKYMVAYDCYNYYSKYEHFGIQTHDIQRRGDNEDIKQMLVAITYCFYGIGLALIYTKEKITNYEEKYNEFLKLIAQSEGLKIE